MVRSLQQCSDLLRNFYYPLASKWLNEAIGQGLDFNEHLRRKGKVGIRRDMDDLFNRGIIQKADFCQCIQELHNILGGQLATIILDILDPLIPTLTITKDVLEIIIAVTLEYCGFTTPSDAIRWILTIFITAALTAALMLLLQGLLQKK